MLPEHRADPLEVPIFAAGHDGPVVDGVVRLTVDGLRAILGYVPIAFDVEGGFDLDPFERNLDLLDETDIARLYAVGRDPRFYLSIIREEGFETVNAFASLPLMTALAAAHCVEATVALEGLLKERPWPKPGQRRSRRSVGK